MQSGLSRRRNAMSVGAAMLLLLGPVTTAAQTQLDLGGPMRPQGDEQRYLRFLTLTDTGAALPVTLQPFGARGDAAARARATAITHAWSARFASTADAAANRTWRWRPEVRVLRPDANVSIQTDRPWPEADGVVWAGRGTTASVQAGIAGRWGPIRMQLAPVAFVAQNLGFPLAANGGPDSVRFQDPLRQGEIDLPQRFGDSRYQRLDLGDSFIELEAAGFLMGLSNARQHWGPALENPLVLGTGSGGFAHFHVGTAAPVNILLGHLQFRVIVGRLEQSAFSPVTSGETSRFLSATLFAFRPAFAPAFEAGAIRAVNGPWPEGGAGLDYLRRPFETIISNYTRSINAGPDNGFASMFLRFAPRGGGLEAYAEMSREDFAGDLRQLYLEPDDLVHTTLGVARAYRRADTLRTLHVEMVNGEVSHFEREGRTLRRPYPPYFHSGTIQGLTNRGQLLGSPGAYGGSAARLRWQRFTPAGRDGVTADRFLRGDWLPNMGPIGGVRHGDVSYRLRFERLRFRGDAAWSMSVAPRYTLNRNTARGADAWGLELQFGWQGWDWDAR